jgi:hypothetical protein
MCEEITQSNQKKADILTEYKDVIKEARRANSFEDRRTSRPKTPGSRRGGKRNAES